MKYSVMVLFMLLVAGQAFSEALATGSQLVRIVCQKDTGDGSVDRILILAQTTSKSLDGDEATDASGLIDPDSGDVITSEVPFRMSIYNTSADFEGKTEEQVIEDLPTGEENFDSGGRRKDFMGKGFRFGDYFDFESAFSRTGPYVFLKTITVSMRDFRGDMNTNLGASEALGDGFYDCRKPVLVPETGVTRAAHEVRRIQWALASLGYRPGPIDGRVGSATRAALAEWERANGVEPTGGLAAESSTALLDAYHRGVVDR